MSFDLPSVFAALADAAVKGTVILLAELVATRLMRRNRAPRPRPTTGCEQGVRPPCRRNRG